MTSGKPNLPRKRTSLQSQKKTTTSRSSRAKKKSSGNLPNWLRNVLAFLLVGLFSAAFYYFVIRPYSYRWKECYGLKGYGICLPCCYEVHGIDISRYQGVINWSKLAESQQADFPLHFVFMKATEGGDHSDQTFQRNFMEAGKHGFIRGAYHFFSPKTDPLKQADFFISTVRLEQGDLPPVLDVEVRGKKTKEEFQRSVITWLNRVESHYGVKPILYTSYKFKNNHLNDSIFNAYPYWIAHYYVDSVRYEGEWSFWQHTDIGTVPGIDHDVDLNVYNGTLEELKELTIRK